MKIVRLGAWCDYVTEDEYRAELGHSSARVDQPEPVPGLMDARFLDEAVAQFRRGASFRVHEFADLADGRRLTLHTDRGFSLSGAVDIWASLTLATLEADVRTTVLPDEDTGEEHPWEWLSELLHARGVDVSPEQLPELPYEVEFSERLRARVP
ncbi:hypothetical protein [Actinophytocola sp.]|uniref:hypothetical protein n=1 Tax=Actinophytocola sp. TaxID=1872138 RepID=UPI002ED52F0F